MPISAVQEMKAWRVKTGDIPLSARIERMNSWLNPYNDIASTLFYNQNVRAVQNWQNRQNELIRADEDAQRKRLSSEYINRANAYTARQNELMAKDNTARISRENTEYATYLNALSLGDFGTASGITDVNKRAREHWNTLSNVHQQTQTVKNLLGDKASTTYMTKTERQDFYNRIVSAEGQEALRDRYDYLMYAYRNFCVIDSIINMMMKVLGHSLTTPEYDYLLWKLYEDRKDVFGVDKFYETGLYSLPGNENYHSKINVKSLEVAKRIKKYLSDYGIDTSNIDLKTESKGTDSYYRVIRIGEGTNREHTIGYDPMTGQYFETLEGRQLDAAVQNHYKNLGNNRVQLYIGRKDTEPEVLQPSSASELFRNAVQNNKTFLSGGLK